MTFRDIIEDREKNKRHFSWKGIEVFIKDDIQPPPSVERGSPPESFNIRTALLKIEKKIPHHLFSYVDSIYVGAFEFLEKRDVQAMYQDSSIYITNQQDNLDDFCEDLVHEIAHSIEENRKLSVYSDGLIEREFIEKRKKLFLILKNDGYEPELFYFQNPEYTQELDSYLYNEIGYAALDLISASLFYSPYAITSLREYFANGFEAMFYYGEADFIRKSCPGLYQKLFNLIEETEN